MKFAFGSSSGEAAIFDGSGYQPISGATLPIEQECTIFWRVNQEDTLCECWIDGAYQGSVAVDGSLLTDNLNVTMGGYNRHVVGCTCVPACWGSRRSRMTRR